MQYPGRHGFEDLFFHYLFYSFVSSGNRFTEDEANNEDEVGAVFIVLYASLVEYRECLCIVEILLINLI